MIMRRSVRTTSVDKSAVSLNPLAHNFAWPDAGTANPWLHVEAAKRLSESGYTSPDAVTDLIFLDDWFRSMLTERAKSSGYFDFVGLESQTGLYTSIAQLHDQLNSALDEIRQLRAELAQRPLVFDTLLYDIGTDVASVIAPIPVVLEETDEEALARWPETRAYGVGATLAEAITELKFNIIELFLDLNSRDHKTLGDIALETLRTLRVHVKLNP